MIELENVFKTYKMGSESIHALNDTNLKIEKGEFVAIMGPSGSGKSTLLNIIGLLDQPNSGSFKLLGNEITHYSEEEISQLRSQLVGFIFQQFHLLKRTSAYDNVAQPLLYYSSEQSKSPDDVLEMVGLGDRKFHKTNELSGGQQQRVAIARSLINSPKILFADEPTGNLDSKSEKEILQILIDLHKQGITIVMVTHEEHVSHIASRVIRMRDGKIISDTKMEQKNEPVISQKSHWKLSSRSVFDPRFLKENLSLSFKSIFSNKVRSFLSMLGILIGVMAVIAMLAIGRGAQESINQQFSSLGTGLLTIMSGPSHFSPSREGGKKTRFNLKDVEAFQKNIKGLDASTGYVSGSGRAVYLNKNHSTSVTGVQTTYRIVQNADVVIGRYFTDAEDKARKRVALIGYTVVTELFGNENPIGKFIKINGSRFEVIGVLKEKGSNGFRDQDDIILIPLQTAMKRLYNKTYLDSISVKVNDKYNIDQMEKNITQFIMAKKKLESDDSFHVRNLATYQEAMSGTAQVLSLLLAMIAAISLVVGGIGIMNIMMVSVTERTREIGLRKAIGASKPAILIQFLIESMMISLAGGGLGVLLGIGISFLVSWLTSWNTIVSVSSVVLSCLFSVGIGLIFGIWPAKKASELRPIDALRFE